MLTSPFNSKNERDATNGLLPPVEPASDYIWVRILVTLGLFTVVHSLRLLNVVSISLRADTKKIRFDVFKTNSVPSFSEHTCTKLVTT